MATLTGQMDMLLSVINGSATVMIRHGGGHEKLSKHLMQARHTAPLPSQFHTQS
jgi:hypothetical protein